MPPPFLATKPNFLDRVHTTRQKRSLARERSHSSCPEVHVEYGQWHGPVIRRPTPNFQSQAYFPVLMSELSTFLRASDICSVDIFASSSLTILSLPSTPPRCANAYHI